MIIEFFVMVKSFPVAVGILSLYLHLPGCTSLKEKRSKIKPILSRLHREFNISIAEMEHQDSWQESVISCALISSDKNYIQRVVQQIVQFTEKNWPDCDLIDQKLEII